MKVLFVTMSVFLLSLNNGFAAKDTGFCNNDKNDPSSKVPGFQDQDAKKKVKGSKAIKDGDCTAENKAAGKC